MPYPKDKAPSRMGRKSAATRDPNPWKTMRVNPWQITVIAFKTYCLVSSTLFISEILRSALDPVYGHVPASRYDGIATLIALLTACSTYASWPGSSRRWAKWLAAIGLAASTIEVYLFRYSGRLGPSFGPLLTSLLTSFPLVLVSAVTAAKRVAGTMEKFLPKGSAQFNGVSVKTISDAFITAICLIAYFEPKIGSSLLNEWLRSQLVRSRLGLYYLLIVFYALLFPSGYLSFMIIPVLQPNLLSAYIPFAYTDQILNSTLHNHDISLIARQESSTGYISVLDKIKDGFRVMRCDHSLLGGQWIPPQGHVSRLHEPIYAVFVMLEAVRLVHSHAGKHQKRDTQQSALVMYAGIFFSLNKANPSEQWTWYRDNSVSFDCPRDRHYSSRNRPRCP